MNEESGLREERRGTNLVGTRLAFIGAGVMAEAMVAGLLRGEIVHREQIVASHPRTSPYRL